MTTFKCSVEGCAAIGVAEGMRNLSRGDTDGELVIVCPRDATIAHKKGFRVFRLADTIARDNRRGAQRRTSMQYFEVLSARKATEEARRRPSIRIT